MQRSPAHVRNAGPRRNATRPKLAKHASHASGRGALRVSCRGNGWKWLLRIGGAAGKKAGRYPPPIPARRPGVPLPRPHITAGVHGPSPREQPIRHGVKQRLWGRVHGRASEHRAPWAKINRPGCLDTSALMVHAHLENFLFQRKLGLKGKPITFKKLKQAKYQKAGVGPVNPTASVPLVSILT